MTPPPATPEHDDDDYDVGFCYRHPDRETALHCVTCERPICVDCAVQSAVGFKCPDDAKVSRAARGVVPPAKAARGIVAGGAVAVLLGGALAVFSPPFAILLGYVVGMATGEATRRSSGGYRDPILARSASALAALGVLLLPLLWALDGSASTPRLVIAGIGAVLAAVAAFQRAI